MANIRNIYKYELKQGNKTVYAGITNNLERREAEHRCEKDFSKMVKIGVACTSKSAQDWERQRLDTYRRTHNGNNPKYNETDHG